METLTENGATTDVRQHGVELAENVRLWLQHNDKYGDDDLFVTFYGKVLIHCIVKGKVEVEYLDAPLLGKNQGQAVGVDRIEDRTGQ